VSGGERGRHLSVVIAAVDSGAVATPRHPQGGSSAPDGRERSIAPPREARAELAARGPHPSTRLFVDHGIHLGKDVFDGVYADAVRIVTDRRQHLVEAPPLVQNSVTGSTPHPHWKLPKVGPPEPVPAEVKTLSAPGSHVTGLAAASGRFMHFQAIWVAAGRLPMLPVQRG
jgi:hypothetical protein